MADFPSIIDLSSLGAESDSIGGGEAGDHAGWSVASAGDVDGDGLCDLLIGAPSDGSGAGKVWLVFGRAGGIGTLDLGALPADRGFLITGAAAGDVAGWSVAPAGDLNHDGKADFVIGARLADAGGAEDSGRAYVIFGGAGLAGPIDLAALDPGRGFAIDTCAGFDHAGWSVAAAGDVNHDGIDDLLIGVPGADGGGTDRGAAFVLFGHDGGFGDVDLAALTPGQGFAIAGGADYDEVGRSLAGAGDVNGDGFDDILVGAAHAGSYAGAAWVVFGQAGGPGPIDLGALGPGQGFALFGAGGEQAGFSVAAAGDVNGDGFGDLIVGAPYAEYGAGRAYVIFGHAGPFAAIDLANLTAAEGFVVTGAAAGDHSGWSVAGGGDLNGDGFDDLVIGAPYADDGGGTDRGAAYVLFGHNGTFGPINLDEITSDQGLAVHGVNHYDQLGRSVAFSGDINNDGLDDLLVGAPYSGAGDSGGAYIIYGKSGTMTTTKFSLASGNFFQNWSNTGLITVNDDWSGVPSIVGYRTGDVTAATGVDARTITTDTGFVVNVIANAASTNTSGGVLEVETGAGLGSPVNPTIGMAGANGNDYAAIVIYLDASSRQDVRLTANIRDLDPSADNAIQQVVVQYRVGSSGAWTNVTGGYFADVTTAGSATQVTAVDLTLPADANNQPEVQIRILTTNAANNDELIGIDDIGVSSNPFVGVENQTVQFNPTSVTHAEGDSGATTYTFTVTRTGGTTGQLNFSGTIAAGSTDNADYVGGTAPTTFNGSILAGQTSATVTVDIQGDYTIEPNEAFTLTLTSVSNTDLSISASIGTNLTGTGNITNDDAAGVISVDDVSIAEGDSGTTAGSFTLHRTGGETGTVTVDYLITLPGGVGGADGSDVSGPLSGTVTFIEGQTTASIPFSINGDTTNEPNETFTVTISNPTNGATISDDTATATITNDDAPPVISIGDASLVEGDNGVTYLVFTVSLSKTWVDPVTVDYDTAGVTATEDGDYLGVSGQLSFAPGETAHTISVPIIGDDNPENNETLTVTLSSPTNATIGDGLATGTVTNDDGALYYSLAGGSFSQNWTNTGQITANDNWSGAPYIIGYLGDIDSGSPTNVDPRTLTGANLGAIDVIANLTATTNTSGGVGEFQISDSTIGLQGSGTADAPSIVLYMDASGRSSVRLQANIRDIDNSAPGGVEDNAAQQINVQYRTDPNGSWINVPGGYFADVTALGATQVTALDVTLPVGADNAATLEIRIMTTNAAGTDEWVGIDDIVVSSVESTPSLSIANAAAFEGDSGPTVITFTVTRAGSSAGAVDADYAVNFGSGPFDASAGDFTGPLSGTVHFDDGETTSTITLSIDGDGGPEGDENFTVVLSNPTVGTIADGSATGTIVNDDGAPPLVTINNVTVTEGDSGTALMTFTVTRTGGTGAFDVDWQTGDLTATDPEDYIGNSGTIHFADGQMTDTITVAVTINGDTDPELSETFQVHLLNPTNFAIITDDIGIGTIASDDPIFIHDIQGTAYFSPILALEGITTFNTASTATVIVRAIVTAVDNDGPRQGFYLQEEIADWDGNSFTSEGIFVFTGATVSGVAVGDLVTVTAHVMEYQGFASNMPVTTLTNPSSIVVQSNGNTLPTLLLDSSVPMPTAIMTLVQPDYTDSSDGVGDTFDASLYALSFWETVEGMLVTIPDMVVADGFVSSPAGGITFQAYSQQHADADQINSRGGYTIAGDPPIGPPDTVGTEDDTISGGRHLSDGDINPDIIEIDFTGFAIDPPAGLVTSASMGDYLGSVTGIIDFDFTDRKLFVTSINTGSFVDHSTTQDVTVLGDDSRSLTVATFNVENLDPTDPLSKFEGLAQAIADNLNMPDIISIEEMQDNNGAAAGDGIDDDPITPGMQDTGGTDASQTWQMLVDALNALTGAHYQWVDEAPVYNAEGGEQSGNIRVGFLYNTDRVQLGDLDADATLAERRMYTDRIGDGVRDAGDLIQFSDNMLGAEIQTGDWSNTRKSLLGEFTFNGNRVYVTANHFPAKGGSDDYWEFNQNPATGEPTNAGWTQRNNVAQDVYSMLNLIQTNAPGAGIVSGGDYNDFYFYRPLTTVTGYTMADGTARIGGARFDNLTLTLPVNERYTYNFDGRSQAIDHIIVNGTLSAVATYDVVHLNTGFNTSDPTPLSDHDPGLSSFNFRNFSEILRADAGNDAIDGFGGTDTLVYAGPRADYTIVATTNANGVVTGFSSVTDNAPGNGDEGTDTLTSIERLQFADMTLDLADRVQLFDGSGNLVGTFDNIQDAIDAASNGYRIEAQAGTYNESLNVDVDVTIEGANAGTAGTGARGPETVITGNVTVSAAGVTINGVEITGAAADTLGTTGVVVQGGANNFSLVNSVLSGTGDLGMIVGLVTGLDVGHNLIEGYATGMYVAGGSTTGSVHDNSFQGDGQSNGTGLINGLQSETTQVTISGNAFDALDGGSLFLFPSGPDTVDLDSYISGNTITNSGADRPVQILPTNLTHNVIGTDYNEAFDGETAALAGVTGSFSYDGRGGDDRAWGGGEDDTFTGDTGNDWLFGNAGDDTAIYSGNRSDYTVTLLSPGVFQVTDNRAGSPDGADRLEGIEYLQFADATLDASQRVQLYDGGGNLVATFDSIQAAIDAASNGYRIIAQAGDYDESLTVDKDVTIEGANAGLAGTDNARGPETVITGQVTISSAGVTIDGVEITGAEADALGTTGVVVEGGANNFSLVNSLLVGSGDLAMIVGLVSGLDVGHNLIALYTTAMYVAGGNTTGSVHDNIFQHLDNGLLSETTHVTISGNTFEDITGGSLFLFPFGPDSVDLDSYISGNTITDSGIPRPVQIVPTNLTHNVIGTDFNEAFDGETAALNGVTGSFSYDGQGGDDHAWGGQAGDTLTGGSGADVLYGEGGDDTLSGGSGNDTLNGNLGGTGDPGTDTATYAGPRGDYTIVTVTDANGVVTGFTSVTDNVTAGLDEGTDTLTSIERLQFADVTLDLADRVQLFDGSGNLVGTFDNIQDAIDAASNGYRIEAQAGTYNESLNVDVDVTIEGANAGTAGTGARGPETVITGNVTVSAAGVTINGVEITGAAADTLGTTGVVVQGGANNFSLVNSVLSGTGDLGMIVGLVTGLDVGHNLIEGYATGMYVAGGSTTGSVHDNSFQGDGQTNGTGLINGLQSETTHVTISGNAFDALDGGSLFLFPSGPDTVDLDSYISGNTITNSGADRPVQILPTNLTHNVIGTDYNEAFDGETAAQAGVTGSFSYDGQGGDDRAWGGGQGDTFTGGEGDEFLYGNGGTDTAVYAGNRADYTIVFTTNSNGVITGFTSVNDNVTGNGDEGFDTLDSIEALRFADVTFDLSQPVQLFDGGGNLVGTFSTIQAAIDAASNSYTIRAAAGTYAETLTVDVDVTIEGANVGIAGTGSRGAETVIDGQITISAAGVTIDGVRMIGSGAGALGTTGIVVNSGADNFSLVNSVLDGTGDLGMIVGPVTGLDVGDNLIEGYSSGIYVSGGSTTGSVHDNSFLGDGQTNGTGLINGLLSETTHVTISGNAFDALDGGSLFLFPSGPDTVDLDSYISGNTITNSGADRPVQILPTNLTHNVIGTDYNEAFDGETAAQAGVTGAFTFDGQGGDDRAWGAGEIDTFTGGAGNDWLFGNAGDDNAIYSGNRSDYTVILLSPGVIQITDDRPGSPDGTDRLEGVERVVFANNDYWVETDGSLSVINDAPLGIDHSFTILEDEVRVLGVADFSFTEIDPTEANQLLEVTIVDLPTAGTIYYDADGAGGNDPVAISAGATFTAADLNDGKLTYVPDLNENGPGYATFTYQVRDDGGTAHGGFDTDPVPNTITVNVTPVNDEPTVTATPANPTYVEDTAAVDLFGTVAVSTVEAGQTLTALTLTVTNVTDGAAEILSFDGSDVALTDGNMVTTATNGLMVSVSLSGTTATVSFSGVSLSEAQVAALVDGLSYRNTSQDPTDADRVVTITQLVDSGPASAPDDNVSAPNLSSTVDVRPVNDEPTLAATATNPTYVEDAPGIDLFSGISVSTIEAGQTITSLTLTVTNVTDGAFEILRIDGTGVALTDGNSFLTDDNNIQCDVTVVGTTATVVLSGASLSTAQTQTLIDALTYRNLSQGPTQGDRVVTITQLVDSGAGTAPDDNLATFSLSSTVSVQSVNDAPTSTLIANDTRTYLEDSPPVTLDVLTNGTISDVDSADFGGGSLTLSVQYTPTPPPPPAPPTPPSTLAEDNLVIINTAIVTTSGNVVSVNGTPIGTFSGGLGGTPLVISFNTNATPAAVQQLVHALGYFDNAGDSTTGGPRTVSWAFNDGDGNANGGNPALNFTSKVNVIPVNDAPDSADVTVPINEDQTYHLQTSDFAFSDPEGDQPGALRIETLPTQGTLYFDPDGAGPNAAFAVSPGLSVSWSSVPDLFYVPDPDSNGTDSFTFAVIDSGGAADTTPNTFTFTVAAVNDGPSVTITPPGGGFETDEQVAIDLQGRIAIDDVDSGAGTITVTLEVDYGIIDVDAGTSGALVADSGTDTVTITGTLAQIQALLDGTTGSVSYTPDTDTPPASAQLTVTIDDGGNTGSPGALDDSDSVTIVIDAINDTPLGTDNSVTTNEDTDRTLTAADFTYSDAEGDDLLSVTIVTLPANGTLLLNGVPIVANDTVVTRAQLDANQLVYRPDPNENGDDQLTFRVQDDGGAGNGAIDTDPVANTLTLSVTAVNDEPTLAATGSDPTYVEDAAAADLFSAVTVSTVEAGQTITSLTLTVTNVTDGADEILSFDGSDVALTDGNSVTSATNGLTVTVSVTGSTATVTFSGAALSEAQAATLIDALAYRNASQDPTDADRVVTVTQLVDSGANGAPDDNVSAPGLASTVDVAPVNDEPTLAATGSDPTYVEDAAAADLFSAVTVSTVEAGQTITSLTLTVTNVTDGADEILSFDGSDVALTDGNSVTTATNGLTVTVSVTGSTATVTFSGAALSEAQAAALIDALAYRNASQDPTDADRVVTITQLVDSGANGAPDDNVSAPGLASTVDVDPVNDVAIITGDITGDVTEAGGVNNGTPGTPTDSGDLDAADPDNTNDGWQAVAAGAATSGGYGTYQLSATGVWTYTLDNGNAAVQALNGAATLTDTFTALTEEGTAQLVTITIHAQDDTPVARADAVTTNEASIVGGNVLANNGSGADSDVDGPALTVAAVNGSGANVGSQITLASGAKLTVNADGTFSYDPNHAFDNTPAPGSGASNQPAADSFTYTLTGGATATVSISITGIDTNDLLLGTAGADVMLAGIGADQLFGLGGDDFLDGGTGTDAMTGGSGNDTFVVDGETDAVNEAVGGGVDTVYALAGFTLGAGQEIEYLSAINQSDTAAVLLVGNEFSQFLYGNAGANYLDGGSGNDTLVGFGGDDSYVVDDVNDYVAEVAGGGNDIVYVRGSFSLGSDQEVETLAALSQAGTAPIVIVGNNFNQIIYGNAGANYLDGGSGNDTLVGFGGDDSYVVDDVNDYVAEVAGGGSDIVYVRGSFSLGAGQEVETLAALSQAGTAAIVIVGNGIDQRLYGNNGDNYLDGGGGTDVLQGFSGNDTYVVDSLGDYVVEGAGEGSDVVYARSSYTLVAGQEIEVLSAISQASTTAMNLTGNEFGNALYGNAGANVLNGGAGADYLQGFGGADMFAFTTALGGGNVDQIADFVSGTDKIVLDDAVFTQLGLGALPASVFATGTAATNEDQRIIYDSATGNLYYDADGNGGGAAVLFATLLGHPPLNAGDFTVI